MILAYKFRYHSENDILSFFLHYYAKNSGLNFAIQNGADETVLYVDGSEEELLKFSDDAISLVPNSIFIAKTEVEVVDEMPQNSPLVFESKWANITPYSANYLINNGKACKNEFGILSGISLYKNGYECVDEGNFDELLDSAFENLLDKKLVKIRDKFGEFEIKIGLDFGFDFGMVTNLKALQKAFVCDEKTQIALASFEKPLISLRTNSIFRKNHIYAKKYFDIKASDDLFLYALCKKLFERGVNFLSLRATDKFKEMFKVVVLDDGILPVCNESFLSQKSQNFINSKNSKNLALFALNLREFGLLDGSVIRVFLSKFDDDLIDAIIGKDEISMLHILIPDSFEKLLEMIKSSENGEKLVDNFQKLYKFPSGKISEKASFYSLFKIASMVLGFDDEIKTASQKLLANASDFVGQKGPRIDYNIFDKNEFDIVKFIKSGMSYKLAGVDDNTLSFGYVESLVYFIDTICEKIKTELKCSDILLSGFVFDSRCVANLALKHIGASNSVKFSREFPLEIH